MLSTETRRRLHRLLIGEDRLRQDGLCEFDVPVQSDRSGFEVADFPGNTVTPLQKVLETVAVNARLRFGI